MEKVFKAGYVLRQEMAYTPSGDYIGDEKRARTLCVKYRIKPEKRNPDSNVCSIGFSSKDGKWYGWSRRVLYGFEIGSKCYCKGREWTAETIADAKQMACDFAENN